MKYRAEIDGLRAIAVVPVIFFHAGFEWFSGGFIGVDVFFVISGYLITTILVNDIETGKFSLLNFYERRIRRILPALSLVTLCCIPFAWLWLLPDQMLDFSQSLIAVSLFASNILFWRESGYFDTAAEEKPLLHTWSLAVEEQYYLFFPIFLILVWRFGKNRVFWTIVCFASLSLLLSEWGARNKPVANFYLAPTRAWELLAGSIAAFIIQKHGVKKNDLLAFSGLTAIFIAIFAFDNATPFPGFYALVPVLGCVLIILYADKGTFVARILSLRALVGLGLISYSAYLWHQPIFAFARANSIQEPSVLKMLALSLASVFLAILSWRFVENPFRKKQVFGNRYHLFILFGVLFGGIILFGYAGHKSNGFDISRQNMSTSINASKLHEAGVERNKSIRVGKCHFTERGEVSDIQEFLEKWDCYSDGAGMIDSKVLVLGDSHAADKAAAIRSSGVDIVQLTAAGCQLAPDIVTPDKPYCFKILEKSKSLIDNGEVRSVFIINWFRFNSVTSTNVEAILQYWGQFSTPVYLWTPAPDFKIQFKRYLLDMDPSHPPSLRAERLFYEHLDKLNVPENITIVKTSSFLCDPESEFIEACALTLDGELLIISNDHFSVKGAEIFGRALQKSGLMAEIVQNHIIE